MSGTISLVLIDDHALFREGLARVLESQPDLEVKGSTASAAAGLEIVGKVKPDVVLLDVDLGQERAIEFVQQARQHGYEGRILVVTAGVSDPEAVQLVRNGISGILHKHNQPEALCNVIRLVATGEVFLEQRYLKPLFQTVTPGESEALPRLTDREVKLLRLLFQGLVNKEIADEMALSESSVKAILRGLFDKLGVRTRSQLVRVALEQYRDQL
ncbi:MAG: response regulator transcription factor [Bryobacterales bacterium]|nr:response regulator transcription factor [Bryobacterales bacterium]